MRRTDYSGERWFHAAVAGGGILIQSKRPPVSVWSWLTHLTSSRLHFPINKMGMIVFLSEVLLSIMFHVKDLGWCLVSSEQWISLHSPCSASPPPPHFWQLPECLTGTWFSGEVSLLPTFLGRTKIKQQSCLPKRFLSRVGLLCHYCYCSPLIWQIDVSCLHCTRLSWRKSFCVWGWAVAQEYCFFIKLLRHLPTRWITHPSLTDGKTLKLFP